MKAVGLYKYLPINNPEALVDLELPTPSPSGKDILVRVKAISVNPVDTKVRAPKELIEKEPKILGWDAAGVVEAIGDKVQHFKIGDEVFYAGDITRSGSNAQYQLVDERIVALKPTTLSFAEAAALPLTSITAWEALFERLKIQPKSEVNSKSTLLIIGGAGGVGSIATQLAKKVAGLKVITTASREETEAWSFKMGADAVINHREPLLPQIQDLGYPLVDYIFCCNDTDAHWNNMVETIRPQGAICSIVDNKEPLRLNMLKPKSATFAWEFMFTRSMFQTPDMIEQQDLLAQVASLVDAKIITTTKTVELGSLDAATLREAHKIIEEGRMIGKLVLTLP